MRTELRIRLAVVTMALLTGGSMTLACGARVAKHGGQVNDDQGEMNFELVSRGRNLVVHLEDHGTPVVTRGASAVVLVKREGGSDWTTKLRTAGDDRFTATLPATLRRGDSVSVNVSFANGSIASGHFSFDMEPKPKRQSFGFAPGLKPPG
ncbi:MAG: hypothetical protein H7Z19_13385, partial [Chitinophagaceae bacterium]|nr:hypothetical protein [Rubrivivax sp.]